jgi:Ca2+-transporting ATPase
MKQQPRNPKESFFARGAGFRAVIGGLLIGLLSLTAFYYGLWESGVSLGSGSIPEEALPYARTMAFVVLAASQLFYALSMRNASKSIFRIGMFSNPFLIGSIIIGILLQLVVISVPVLANAFGVHNLSLKDWAIVIVFALVPCVVNEFIKLFRKKS